MTFESQRQRGVLSNGLTPSAASPQQEFGGKRCQGCFFLSLGVSLGDVLGGLGGVGVILWSLWSHGCFCWSS